MLAVSSFFSMGSLVPLMFFFFLAKIGPGYILRIYHLPHRNRVLAAWVIAVKTKLFLG